MKYMIYCTFALVICLIMAFIIAKIVLKKLKRKTRKIETAITTLVICVALYCLVALGYLSVYYHADMNAVNKAFNIPSITTAQLSGGRAEGYAFTKEGNDKALIFYAGAKVDELAYSPLMAELTDGGIDCYLVESPFHMPLFAADSINWFIENYSEMHYNAWMVGGHSMGGIVVAKHAVNHSDVIDGIILLASYSNAEIPKNMALCSIYGSNDGCLSLGQYERNRVNFPDATEEHIINGGNHAQFASYGTQKGDKAATISPETQVNETAEIILRFAEKIK